MNSPSLSTIQRTNLSKVTRPRDINNPMDFTLFHFNRAFEAAGLAVKMIYDKFELANLPDQAHVALKNGYKSYWEHEWDEDILESPIKIQVRSRDEIGPYAKNHVINMRSETILTMEPGETMNLDTTPQED